MWSGRIEGSAGQQRSKVKRAPPNTRAIPLPHRTLQSINSFHTRVNNTCSCTRTCCTRISSTHLQQRSTTLTSCLPPHQAIMAALPVRSAHAPTLYSQMAALETAFAFPPHKVMQVHMYVRWGGGAGIYHCVSLRPHHLNL